MVLGMEPIRQPFIVASVCHKNATIPLRHFGGSVVLAHFTAPVDTSSHTLIHVHDTFRVFQSRLQLNREYVDGRLTFKS